MFYREKVVGLIGIGLGLLKAVSDVPGDGRAVSANDESVFAADDVESLRADEECKLGRLRP